MERWQASGNFRVFRLADCMCTMICQGRQTYDKEPSGHPELQRVRDSVMLFANLLASTCLLAALVQTVDGAFLCYIQRM
jgi:heme A synthase